MRYLLEHRELIPQMSEEVYKLTEERYERSKMIKRVYDHREELLKKYKIK